MSHFRVKYWLHAKYYLDNQIKENEMGLIELYNASIFAIIVVMVHNLHQKLSVNISLFVIIGWFSQ
jgi:hypothetical protein